MDFFFGAFLSGGYLFFGVGSGSNTWKHLFLVCGDVQKIEHLVQNSQVGKNTRSTLLRSLVAESNPVCHISAGSRGVAVQFRLLQRR
jgi:hypothetical protein